MTAIVSLVLGFAASLGAFALVAKAMYVVAQPDEWLLCVRNGRLAHAGVGIAVWRRPGDVVVRFTTTLQRVTFTVEALSSERLAVAIDGFLLWSVSPTEPYRTYQRLGVANLEARAADLKSARHLLTGPQYKAFQQILGATVQRLAAGRTLESLLLQQDLWVADLREAFRAIEAEMAIAIQQVDVVRVRPADEALVKLLAAKVEERVRGEAAAERAEARRTEAEREHELRLGAIERERKAQIRADGAVREHALAEEARNLEVARAVAEREELALAAKLDRRRREAEAERDAATAITSAEEAKSQPVREHELALRVADKVGDALRGMKEARWITVNDENPVASLVGLLTSAGDLAPPKKAA